MYTKFQKSLKDFLDGEREAWRKLHQMEVDPVELLNREVDEQIVIDEINRAIIPNYDAYVERVHYFDDNMNDFLCWGCLPMQAVYSCFDLFKETPEGMIFERPQSIAQYAKLSLIISLVKSVCIMTKYDSETHFQYPLEDTERQMTPLAIKVLNLSKYRKYPYVFAVYTLLMVRLTTYTLGTDECVSEDHINSFILFQQCLDMCYQLGAHRDSRLVVEVYSDALGEHQNPKVISGSYEAGDHLTKLWNYMKMLDAFYSCDIGDPLLINYEFCDASPLSGFKGEYVQILRDVATTINSVRPISINDILSIMDRLMETARGIESFTELITSRDAEVRSERAFRFIVKMRLLEIYQRLCHYLKANLEDLDFFPKQQEAEYLTDANVGYLARLTQKLACRDTCCSILFLSLIREVCERDTIFGPQAGKYIVVFKPFFCNLLRSSCKNFVSCFFIKDSKLKGAVRKLKETGCLVDSDVLENPFWAAGKLPEEHRNGHNSYVAPLPSCDIDGVKNLEPSLYTRVEEVEQDCRASLMVSRLVRDPGNMIGFLSDFYNSVVEHEALAESYNFFLRFKYLVMMCYIMETLVRSKLSTSDLKPGSSSWTRVVEETRERMEDRLNVGTLDRRLDLDPDHIGSFIDCINANAQVWTMLDESDDIRGGLRTSIPAADSKIWLRIQGPNAPDDTKEHSERQPDKLKDLLSSISSPQAGDYKEKCPAEVYQMFF
ncbi:DEKNAAC100551 [Brettanomyces naardenensis]|uniref:DEKNAAC100551 n=1 Tax=Brettanomyces naardenensis TaxID=13370 RepID=A0A448YG74_BRENA|nr:DEKNAAC100551 [Brettanomyces naardenensis]